MDIKLMPEKYKSGREVAGDLTMPDLTKKTGLWFTLSVIFLIVAALLCLGLWLYQNNLNKEKDNLVKQREVLESQRDLDMEGNFIELKQGIENLKNALEIRIYPSKLFAMLEQLTLPQVQFTNFSADLSQATVRLSSQTVDYTTLAKQIVVFEKDERIKQVGLAGVELNTLGGINADLAIELNPSFLRPVAE